ncbi:hypothetical protein AZE42_05210 [Rhizopogon vesiculosus]|uniref:Uncharacterized protein n=1 Tax=Rhizopogon vesiculosus TaxID=180088 RepID=A0A1J8PZ04_9AGAM|nr:hypothetical protein AZE42_05210 [Rhizopogon vesiculosus]
MSLPSLILAPYNTAQLIARNKCGYMLRSSGAGACESDAESPSEQSSIVFTLWRGEFRTLQSLACYLSALLVKVFTCPSGQQAITYKKQDLQVEHSMCEVRSDSNRPPCSTSCSSFLFHSPTRYHTTYIRYFLALNLNMVDPTAEVCPDFAAEFYDNIRGDIGTAIGQPDVQIIDRLIQSWTKGHNRRVGE